MDERTTLTVACVSGMEGGGFLGYKITRRCPVCGKDAYAWSITYGLNPKPDEVVVTWEHPGIEHCQQQLDRLEKEPDMLPPDNAPIPMLLWCPSCRARHVDVGEYATRSHHTHACQSCGMVWRPAIVATVGVRFLPGFQDESDEQGACDPDPEA